MDSEVLDTVDRESLMEVAEALGLVPVLQGLPTELLEEELKRRKAEKAEAC